MRSLHSLGDSKRFDLFEFLRIHRCVPDDELVVPRIQGHGDELPPVDFEFTLPPGIEISVPGPAPIRDVFDLGRAFNLQRTELPVDDADRLMGNPQTVSPLNEFRRRDNRHALPE